MSILTGLAAEALEDFGEDFESGVLTVPGQKVSDGQGGFTTSQPATHGCKALVTDPSDYRRLSLGIPATDRLVLVLGASLPSGVIPGAGQKITAPDPLKGLAPSTFAIIAKSSDPAGALYKLQAR